MDAMIAGLEHDKNVRFAGQKMMIRAAYSGDFQNGVRWLETLQKAFPELRIEIDPLPISIACHIGDGRPWRRNNEGHFLTESGVSK